MPPPPAAAGTRARVSKAEARGRSMDSGRRSVLENPVEIGLVAQLHLDRDDLGKFVWVEPEDRLPELIETRGGRLDQQQRFAVLLDFALPAVDRLDLRDDVDAGGVAGLHQGAGK